MSPLQRKPGRLSRLAAYLVGGSFGLLSSFGAWAQMPADPECGLMAPIIPTISGINPLMRIKIYNDSDKNIYPVLTMGKGPVDIWMQMAFRALTKKMIDTGNYPFPRDLAYRIYMNPDDGIKPKEYICLTLPLYTKLVESPAFPMTNGIDPKGKNQFIDWWQGGTIQIFYSDIENGVAVPPRALKEDQNKVAAGQTKPRPDQKPLDFSTLPKTAIRPRCKGTQTCKLAFYSDSADLAKADPSQLLEFTLGARQDITGSPGFNPAILPPNVLDARNVDFDVSYVNLAYLPAAMGVYDNNQVGYVGTPQAIDDPFRNTLGSFLQAPETTGWPQFVRTYANGDAETLKKLPSPLEIFSRLNGVGAPPDLTAAPDWPNKLWPPIEKLRQNWLTAVQNCASDTGDFCTAINDISEIMKLNYLKYKRLFAAGACSGTAYTEPNLDMSSNVALSHVYGWGPFTESTDGIPGHGCAADANKLEDTPCSENEGTPCFKANNYAKYAKVKREFDSLNYNKLTGNNAYVFNPWVNLIHNQLGIPGAYAYSVDDAVGNVQAEGGGIVVDIGGTAHLPNPEPATPPIAITLAPPGANDPVKFTQYALCNRQKVRNINPYYSTLAINANHPEKCPIFAIDSANRVYTFTIATSVGQFPKTDVPVAWSPQYAAPIDCSSNKDPRSKLWCCDKSSSSGVWAYAQTDPTNVHGLLDYKVSTITPLWGVGFGPQSNWNRNDQACNRGQ